MEEKNIKKACIRKAKATAYSHKHNFRIEEPSYLLPKQFIERENINWQSTEDFRKIFKEEIKKKYPKGKQKSGKMPKFENQFAEFVVQMNSSTTAEDIGKLANEITEKTGMMPVSVTIHNDEGHLIEKETGRNLTPKKDYYTKNGISYLIRKGKYTDEPLDLSKYEAVHNYHAHFVYFGYLNGQSIQHKMTRQDMSKLQDIAAETLGMERGKNYAEMKQKAPKNLSPSEYREMKYKEQKMRNLEQKNKKLEQKSIADEFEKLRLEMRVQNAELRENQKEAIFKRSHYAILDEMKKNAILSFENNEKPNIPTLQDIQKNVEKTQKLDEKISENYANIKQHRKKRILRTNQCSF